MSRQRAGVARRIGCIQALAPLACLEKLKSFEMLQRFTMRIAVRATQHLVNSQIRKIMNRKHTHFYAMVALVLVSACGGGGSDNAAPANAAAAKYYGTWSNCAPITGAANGITSFRTDFVFTEGAVNSLNVTVNAAGYTASNCAGTPFNQINAVARGTAILAGTKVVGNATVDLSNWSIVSQQIPDLNGDFKDIMAVSGNTLKFGAPSAPDAQGYPTAVDDSLVYTKR
jgi:hypothetical protein